MTNSPQTSSSSAKQNGLLDFLGYIPLIGSIVKAHRFGKDKDIVLALLSIIAILGVIVFLFGYPAFIAIILIAAGGYLAFLMYMLLMMKV